MSTYQWKNMDAGLLSMVAKVARNEPLSAAEQLSVAESRAILCGGARDLLFHLRQRVW